MWLYVSLNGFTGNELATLAHHLTYAAERRQSEINRLRNSQSGPRARPKQQKSCPLTYVTSPRLCRFIREQRFLHQLGRAVARADSQIDLSSLLNNGGQPFLDFLEHELHRTRWTVAYIEATPFDRQTRRDLFCVLDIELRFFSRLLNYVQSQCDEGLIIEIYLGDDRDEPKKEKETPPNSGDAPP